MQNFVARMKKDIREFTKANLQDWFLEQDEKKFRANQVWEWLWQKSALDFDEMSNLSLELRQKLKNNFLINAVRLDSSQFSSDRTIKSGFKLHDGHLVEGVLIPTQSRMTACVSSQVGCSLSCKFCATGYMGRARNLTAAEIYDQVVLIKKQAEDNYQAPLTNVVYMGMGEPLLNYAATLQSIDRLTAEDGLNWSPKRITVSTAGIAKMIKKLGDDGVKFNLALSLHAANDIKRNTIMPINESNSLVNLRDALNYFYAKTGNAITLEYIVFHGFNDTLEDAKDLLEFVKRVPSKVNIIEYNPIAEAKYRNADPEAIDKFAKFLEQRGVTVNVRRSRGKDIDAACGQLAIKEQ